MAEREGFEPSRRDYRLHAFQACAFSHSATSPHAGRRQRPESAAIYPSSARTQPFKTNRMMFDVRDVLSFANQIVTVFLIAMVRD